MPAYRHPSEFIAPYNMRRIFKMRDPYAVLLARHWARDLATVECVLMGLSLFVLMFGISWNQYPPWQQQHGDDYLPSPQADDITVGGIHLTGQVHFRSQFDWAMFALIPWVHKGLLIFLDVLAITCSCQGNCIASCFHRQLWCCDETGILKTMGVCSAMSSVTTALSIAGTTVVLLIKWKGAMSSGDVTSTLLFMTIYGLATVLLMYLRTSAALKAFTAHQVLVEEVIDV